MAPRSKYSVTCLPSLWLNVEVCDPLPLIFKPTRSLIPGVFPCGCPLQDGVQHTIRDLCEGEAFPSNLSLPSLPEDELHLLLPAPRPLSTPGKIWTPAWQKPQRAASTPQWVATPRHPTWWASLTIQVKMFYPYTDGWHSVCGLQFSVQRYSPSTYGITTGPIVTCLVLQLVSFASFSEDDGIHKPGFAGCLHPWHKPWIPEGRTPPQATYQCCFF